jgi:Glutathione S-transferase
MASGLQNYVVEETSDEWVLYHNNFSLCSRKVRLCLEEIGLDYRSEHIDLIETGKYEVASKKFLKINPGATCSCFYYTREGPFMNRTNKFFYLVEPPDNKNYPPLLRKVIRKTWITGSKKSSFNW